MSHPKSFSNVSDEDCMVTQDDGEDGKCYSRNVSFVYRGHDGTEAYPKIATFSGEGFFFFGFKFDVLLLVDTLNG